MPRLYTNKPIRNVVQQLASAVAYISAQSWLQRASCTNMPLQNLDIRFVANVDGYDLSRALKSLDPETTLFIVASKSFSTLETLENARSARA